MTLFPIPYAAAPLPPRSGSRRVRARYNRALLLNDTVNSCISSLNDLSSNYSPRQGMLSPQQHRVYDHLFLAASRLLASRSAAGPSSPSSSPSSISKGGSDF